MKTGTTTRVGKHDGLTVDQAVERYFEELAAHGWADRVTDRAIGTVPITTPSGALEPILETVIEVRPGEPSPPDRWIRSGW